MPIFNDFVSENNHDVQISFEAILTETDNAIMFRLDADNECWLPKSQIHVDEDDKDITLPKWLVISKNLESFIITS